MADNRASKHTTADQSTDVEALRRQCEQAQQSGDTARVTQLDEQIRQAEAK